MALTIMNCMRCNHEWASKHPEKVRVCPRCKTAYWNQPRKKKEEMK